MMLYLIWAEVIPKLFSPYNMDIIEQCISVKIRIFVHSEFFFILQCLGVQ